MVQFKSRQRLEPFRRQLATTRPERHGRKDVGKSLVIVESPAKARTISRYLGRDYLVDSSIGHIRDLPQSASQIPPKFKKEKWSRLGVDVDNAFTPLYVVPAEKKKKVSELKSALQKCDRLLLATDEDREGEAISWHLVETLDPKVPYSRLVFHEITREAIQDALQHTRPIDEKLVSAQETRRILDRLYGYEISPLLWKIIGPRLSAGRVQSVAIRILVEREMERMRFRESIYWDLQGIFATQAAEEFEARLVSLDNKRIASGKDFDPATGQLKNTDAVLVGETRARALIPELQKAPWQVTSTETKPFTQRPSPPFTTSTLQQEGARKLRFTARRTMQVAQRLYENGYITYMRTDSTTLSDQALQAARSMIVSLYDNSYLSSQVREYRTRVKNAQEAHEAIRPAGETFRSPDEVRGELQSDEFRLYELIWKRTLACQMADAKGRRLTARLSAANAVFQAAGKVIDFPGFLRVYAEQTDDPEADPERILPAMQEGDRVDCKRLEAKEHRTLPPARFTEASLVKELEADGIGRPSTYASIIDTIERREYTFKEGAALVPTFLAFAVVNLLRKHFPDLVDTRFTARMEDNLDAISRGEADSLAHLQSFYFGNGTPGLRDQLDAKMNNIDPRDVCSILLGEDNGQPVVVRVGRYGPFLQRGEDTAPIPDNTAPDQLTLERSLEILALPRGPQELGTDPESGEKVYVREGRFGPYVQLGEMDDKKKPKTQSLLKGMTSDSVGLEMALKLLRLPRVVGSDAEGVEITAHYGRYGAYIKRGADTRSLDDEQKLFTLTTQEALALLAQPKRGRRRNSEPLHQLGRSEDLDADVRVMQGPYGPYVTDGRTNASVPKGTDPALVTLAQAVDLIRERMARGPVTRRKRGTRKAAPASGRKTTRKATTRERKRQKATARTGTTRKATTRKTTTRKATTRRTAGKTSGRAQRVETD